MRGNSYWEGTCRVEGSAQGRAYVEMTGYEMIEFTAETLRRRGKTKSCLLEIASRL